MAYQCFLDLQDTHRPCKEYPEYDLNVYQETAVKLEEMLRNGEIQVALMTGTEELEKDSNFHVEEISTEEICLIAPKSKHFHGIAKYGFRYPWIDIRQMENEKFIMLNKGSRLRYVTDKVLKNHSMDPKQIEFSSIETIWELVSKDFGVALASDFQYPKNLDVDVFSICSAYYRNRKKYLSRLNNEEGSGQNERKDQLIKTGIHR